MFLRPSVCDVFVWPAKAKVLILLSVAFLVCSACGWAYFAVSLRCLGQCWLLSISTDCPSSSNVLYCLSCRHQSSGAVLTAGAQAQAFPAAVNQSSFIMISCAGNPKRLTDDSMDAAVQARVLTAKQKGEASVRQCGLAYTVIRPGPLVEEPGGYRGLVFDQVGSSGD